MKSSREQFEEWFKSYVVEIPDLKFPEMDDGEYVQGEDYDEQFYIMLQAMWMAWQASRAAIASALTPAYWITYWPDTPGKDDREHSRSGPESCARRIASEIGGYVVPVYYGAPS